MPATAKVAERARAPRAVAGRRSAADVPVTVDARQLLENLSLVVAPTTLATALLYWFGFELVSARSEYFGLGIGTLGFSTTDYLIRGVEAGILPLIALLLALAAAVLLFTIVDRRAGHLGDRPWFPWAARGVLGLGLLATVTATYGAFRPLPAPLDGYLLPPILLGTGPVVTAWGLRLMPGDSLASGGAARVGTIAVSGLVVISAFWGMSVYADALGRGRAESLARSLGVLPAVTVYSKLSLAIHPDVAESERVSEGDQARYSYRYSGLRLLLQSDGKYFLLPDNWSHGNGMALVVRDEPDIRIELSPGG